MIRAERTSPQLASAARDRDTAGLLFVAEMYGVQLDQLASVLEVSDRRATGIAARWVERGHAQTGWLGPGARWAWLTRAGLTACGLPYAASPPALSRLAHLRAVTAVRLALEAVPAYAEAAAHWRSERHLRARLGGRLGRRDHLPDAEVHWPDLTSPDRVSADHASPGVASPGLASSSLARPDHAVPGAEPGPGPAGECWAIEVELTPKTLARTTAIMRELLTRTSDYGVPAAEAQVRGHPPRHTRAVYLCSPAATGVVGRARDALGPDADRIEIRSLPPAASLPAPAQPAAGRPRASP